MYYPESIAHPVWARGWFHIIERDECFGYRRGIIVEKDSEDTYGITLLLSFVGKTKQPFVLHYAETTTPDYPVYWLRITWQTPQSFTHTIRAMAKYGHKIESNIPTVNRYLGSFGIYFGKCAESDI